MRRAVLDARDGSHCGYFQDLEMALLFVKKLWGYIDMGSPTINDSSLEEIPQNDFESLLAAMRIVLKRSLNPFKRATEISISYVWTTSLATFLDSRSERSFGLARVINRQKGAKGTQFRPPIAYGKQATLRLWFRDRDRRLMGWSSRVENKFRDGSFFRSKRRALISEGKTVKYAVGEVFLIMIGIFLALQLNNGNDERKVISRRIAPFLMCYAGGLTLLG